MSLSPFNQACRICHGYEYATYKESKHSEIRCSSCHAGSAFSERLKFRLSLTAMPLYFFYGEIRPEKMNNDNCLQCHLTQIQSVTDGKGGVRMSHQEVTQNGYLCADCHTDTAHPSEDQVYGFVDMKQCMSCHNGVNASKECKDCHTREDYSVEKTADHKTAFKVIHIPFENHGKGPLGICGECHKQNYCSECHVLVKNYGVSLPHPDDWPALHSKVTNRETVQVCYACHERKLCTDCHIVEMPHEEDYLAVHFDRAEEFGEQVCMRCHQDSDCTSCHEQHRHPGIPPELREQLERMPVKVE